MLNLKLIRYGGYISTICFLTKENSNTFEGYILTIYPDKSITEHNLTIQKEDIKRFVEKHDYKLYVADKNVTFKEFEEIIKRSENNEK